MAFYKKFEHSLQNEHHFLTLELLEKFYSPTKIYDSESKKLLWETPKKNLTKQQKQNIISNVNTKPTVEKVISEYFTGN